MRLGHSTLPLACRSGAAERIEVPELDVFGEVLDADFSVHVGAGLTEPNDAELGLRALILEIDDVTRFELSSDALQRSAVAADGAQAGGLGEGAGVCVHTSDLHGKLDKNALLAAPVHELIPQGSAGRGPRKRRVACCCRILLGGGTGDQPKRILPGTQGRSYAQNPPGLGRDFAAMRQNRSPAVNPGRKEKLPGSREKGKLNEWRLYSMSPSHSQRPVRRTNGAEQVRTCAHGK